MLMMNRRVLLFLMRRRDSFFKADADAEDAHVTDAVAMLMMQKSKGDLFLIVQLSRTELVCSDLGADDDKPDQNCTSTSC